MQLENGIGCACRSRQCDEDGVLWCAVKYSCRMSLARRLSTARSVPYHLPQSIRCTHMSRSHDTDLPNRLQAWQMMPNIIYPTTGHLENINYIWSILLEEISLYFIVQWRASCDYPLFDSMDECSLFHAVAYNSCNEWHRASHCSII